jgi:hypothetical protein
MSPILKKQYLGRSMTDDSSTSESNVKALDAFVLPKAKDDDLKGRFREIIMDPLNVLIERDPRAGLVEGDLVYLHNGNRVPISGPGSYYGDFSDILIFNRGVHEPLEEFVFQEVLKKLPANARMLELGAYWSHYSMWLKRCLPHSRTTMVEPIVENVEAGKGNFALNGFEGTFIQDFVGKGRFQVDQFMAEQGMAGLEVLHADIQGFELEMLAGAEVSLREGRVDCVFVSTHSQSLHRSVVETMQQFGMRVEIEADFEYDSTSFDGLVFASSERIAPYFPRFKPMGRQDLLGSRAVDRVAYLTGR